MPPRPTRAPQAGARDTAPMRRPRRVYMGKLYVDPSRIPAEFVYEWKRESVLGQHDPTNMSENLITGWMPVPADRHPELVPPPFPGMKPDGFIRRGGLILCQRPREAVEEDLEDLRLANEDQIAALDAENTEQYHPLMPALPPERSTRVEVGIPRNRTGGGTFE